MNKEIINEAVLEKGRSIRFRNEQNKIQRIEDIPSTDSKRNSKIIALKRNEALHVLWYFEPENVAAYHVKIGKNPGEKFDPYKYGAGDEEFDMARRRVENEEWPEKRIFWPQKMEDWIKSYWNENLNDEKAFYISFEEADKLIAVKDIKDIEESALALLVKNINNPDKVKARWIHFKTSMKDKMKLTTEDGEMNLFYKNQLFQPEKKPQVFRLDPFFFKAWTKEEVANLHVNDDPLTTPSRQHAFKVFKGFIKNQVDNNELIGNVPYKDLYLVGRMVDIGENEKNEYGVVILVAKPKNGWQPGTTGLKSGNQRNFWDFQIQPWKSNGPDGNGGGGAMP